jgi:hypothetical protein
MLSSCASSASSTAPPAPHDPTPPPPPPPVDVPGDGLMYFGVQLQWTRDTTATYASRLGHTPALLGEFLTIPFIAKDLDGANQHVAETATADGRYFLTVETPQGLDAVTTQSAAELAAYVSVWNAQGVDVLVRFDQEMNGSWYAWGQKPTEYIRAFRLIADTIHARAPRAAMVWSPSYGGGYPFQGPQSAAQPGSPDFAALDTNHDGRIAAGDDPYGPYYPGDRYVDWVGLTLYHFGDKYPWGKNVVAEHNKFVDQLSGHYNGANGDDSATPNFYTTYAVGHHKPMMISETSALYNEARAGTGDTEVAIKSDWIAQVFDPAVAHRFPLLKAVVWFEHEKNENGIDGVIDWRATQNAQVLTALQRALSSGRFLFAS